MIARLSRRERLLVGGGLVLVVLLLVWLGLLEPYLNALKSLDRRIANEERNLVKVEQMQRQILQLQQQLQKVDRRQGRRSLFARVEDLTEQTGVRQQLQAMRPQPASLQGDYRQQLVEVRLEKLQLGQLVKLLHAIEYRSGGVQVKSLRVKPRFEDRSLLDASMVLMALEKL